MSEASFVAHIKLSPQNLRRSSLVKLSKVPSWLTPQCNFPVGSSACVSSRTKVFAGTLLWMDFRMNVALFLASESALFSPCALNSTCQKCTFQVVRLSVNREEFKPIYIRSPELRSSGSSGRGVGRLACTYRLGRKARGTLGEAARLTCIAFCLRIPRTHTARVGFKPC